MNVLARRRPPRLRRLRVTFCAVWTRGFPLHGVVCASLRLRGERGFTTIRCHICFGVVPSRCLVCVWVRATLPWENYVINISEPSGC